MRAYRYFKNIIRNIKYLYRYNLQLESLEILHNTNKNSTRLESVEHNLRAENGINIKIDNLDERIDKYYDLLFNKIDINSSKIKDVGVDMIEEYKRTEEHREDVFNDIESIKCNVENIGSSCDNQLYDLENNYNSLRNEFDEIEVNNNNSIDSLIQRDLLINEVIKDIVNRLELNENV